MHIYVVEEVISSTLEYPYKGWIAVQDLNVNCELILSDGSTKTISSVQIEFLDDYVFVYNLEIEDYHTYFVSALEILVHNKCNLTKINDSWLKRKGFDAHSIKRELVGKSNVSRYDMYYDKKTGAIFLLKKGAKEAAAIATEYFIK